MSAVTQLHSGLPLVFVAPVVTPEILFQDLPHQLSRIARFAGGTDAAYSVAQHSVLMARAAEAETGDTTLALLCLLHDAHEIAFGDRTAPGRQAIREEKYRQAIAAGCGQSQAESQLARDDRAEAAAIYRMDVAFRRAAGAPEHPSAETLERVAEYDLRALATERRDLLVRSAVDWSRIQGVKPLKVGTIRAWNAEKAREAFVDALDRLAPLAAADAGRLIPEGEDA